MNSCEILKLRVDLNLYKSRLNSNGIFCIVSPRFMPILLMRFSFFFRDNRLKSISKVISLINFLFFGIEISGSCIIGPGIFFPHTIGIVLGAQEIGDNCVIYGGVTIGSDKLDINNVMPRPIIMDNVVIGTGSVILGDIVIGNNVKIEPNCMIKSCIAPNSIVRFK